jgi:hypothetical protein
METQDKSKVDELLASLTNEEVWELVKKLPSHKQFSVFSLLDKMESRKRGEFTHQVMSRGINLIGGENDFADGFMEQFKQEHRTLQQGQLRLIFKVIEFCAEMADSGYYDGRNEAGFKACQKAREALKDAYLPLI